MIRPGPLNHITDVKGIKVGNAQDKKLISGVTVVVPEMPAVAAVDCRGGGPGTRETDALRPENLIEHVHAIVLSGGSAPGLEAANGVSDWLQERGKGFHVREDKFVPIVPAAILFDLNNGGNKNLNNRHQFYDLGYQAISNATTDLNLGNVGAGTGAKSGNLKGGLGSASLENQQGLKVGALTAVNSFGRVTLPDRPEFWAWPFERNKELGGLPAPNPDESLPLDYEYTKELYVQTNTTLCVVAVDVLLNRSQALRIAIMAQDGLARAIRPVHTPFDGDIVFVLATGEKKISKTPTLEVAHLGMMAADCVARSVARGVFEAETLGRFPSYRSFFNLDQ